MDFRDKIKNLKADPGQGAWQEMSTLLDQNKPPRRLSKIWVFVLILLFLSLAILGSNFIINKLQNDSGQLIEQHISINSQKIQESDNNLDGFTETESNNNIDSDLSDHSANAKDLHSSESAQSKLITQTSKDVYRVNHDVIEKALSEDDASTNHSSFYSNGSDLKSKPDLSMQNTEEGNSQNNSAGNITSELGATMSNEINNSDRESNMSENVSTSANMRTGSSAMGLSNEVAMIPRLQLLETIPYLLEDSEQTEKLTLNAKLDRPRQIKVIDLARNIMEFQWTYGGADGVSPIVHYRAGYKRLFGSDWAIGVRYGIVRGNKKARDISLITANQVPSFIEAYNQISEGADENTRVEYTDMSTYSLQAFRHLLQKDKVDLWAGVGPRYSRVSQQRIVSIFVDDGLVAEVEAEQKNYNSLDIEFSLEMDVKLRPNFKLTGVFNATPGLAYYAIGIGSKVYF